MTLSKKARAAEAKVGRAIDSIVGRIVGPSPRQPLEVLHALLEHLERQVQPAARGTWTFPFNRLTIELAAPSRDAKARLTAVVGDAASLRARITDTLKPTCRVGPIDVRLRFRAQPAAGWTTPEFNVVGERVDAAGALPRTEVRPAAEPPPSLELTVASGIADRRRFTFTATRVDIGRGAEVLDAAQRLVRRNGVAFGEDACDENRTVSRRHAHVLYRPASREYRVYDDNSARGTHIVRDGVTIPVPPGTRGVRLQPGDELMVGQARLLVKISP
jgi:FHA domain